MRRPSSIRRIGAAGGQIWLTGRSGTPVRIVGAGGAVVARGEIDDFGDRLADMGVTGALTGWGGFLARDLAPGDHRIRFGGRWGRSLRVRLPPDEELPADYEERVLGQRIESGYGYLQTRDGTTLSHLVALPDADRWGPPPYPTVVQYSPYWPSRPHFLTGEPEHDHGLNTEANVALLSGYAVVGLNLRGTGGSGGAFRMWDEVEGLDGLDAVEAIARQPWCGRVGLIGRSAPGFTQPVVAAARPPSLAAIVPAAFTARPIPSGFQPGGIPNVWVRSQLAAWRSERASEEAPGAFPPRYDPAGWDGWVVDHLAQSDDETAVENQLLRGHTLDPVTEVDTVSLGDPVVTRRLSPIYRAPDIDCPTLLIGSWQDEASGPGMMDLLPAFPAGTPVRALVGNGTHEETRYPQVLAVMLDFLSEHLRGGPQPPAPEAEAYLRVVTRERLGEHSLPLASPELPTGRVTVCVDRGAGPHGRGLPEAAMVLGFDEWPPAQARRTSFSFDADGGLVVAPEAPSAESTVAYRYDPSARPATSAPDDTFDANRPMAQYDWRPPPEGHGLLFATAPLDRAVLACGPASVDLWVRAGAPDIDIEVTLTELRSDGYETYLQGGWLRAGHRRLDDAESTDLVPVHTFRDDDVEDLPAGDFAALRIPVPPFAHLLRARSRLALRIEAPGGVQPVWAFAPLWPDGHRDGEPITVEVAVGGPRCSSMVVSLLDSGLPEPLPPLPPPGSLRRQPTRVATTGPYGSRGLR